MPKYSIIIPVLGKDELTHACLASIHAHSENYEIIIVDNGNSRTDFNCDHIIRNEENLGFPKAINQGIGDARGEILILLNNDTIVSPGWLEHLEPHLANYDMVGPVTNCISGPQQLNLPVNSSPEAVKEVSEAIYKRNAGRSMPFFRLVFFCVAIKRAVIEKLGGLDERFTPGNFEDDDYCLQAIEAGFKLGIAEDVFIYHLGSASRDSYPVEYTELLKTNEAKFKEKWSGEKYDELRKKAVENCAGNPPQRKQTLALVMIAKNEELGLERAINSARPYVDQVVVAVDNSSSDKTLEIATRLADVVKTYDWRDDFAWARNFAHEDVKTDWIVFLDGHEYIAECVGLELMLSSPADALLCTVELENGSQIRNPRIYRNGLQFEGKVHEIQNARVMSVFSSFLVMHARAGGQSLGASALRDKQRADQVPRIMRQQLEDDPTNIRASLHLALYEQSIGNFKQALKYQKQYFKYAQAHGERWYMFFNKALCQMSLGRSLRAQWALCDAEKETPGRWEVAKLRGLIYYNKGDFTRAIKYFVDAFDPNLGDTTFKPWKIDHVDIFNLIGQSYFNLGMPSLAGEAFKKAFELCPDGENKKLYYDRAKVMRDIVNS